MILCLIISLFHSPALNRSRGIPCLILIVSKMCFIKKDTSFLRCLHTMSVANHNSCPVIILLFKRLLKSPVYLTSYTTTVFSSKHYKSFIHFLLNPDAVKWRRYFYLRFDNLAILFYNSIYYWHSLSFLFRGP